MTTPIETTGEQPGDFTLPDGCLLCDGELAVRATPGGLAYSYCAHCKWLSRPRVRVGRRGMLELAYPTQADA